MKPPSPRVEKIETIAPMPFLRSGKPALAFRHLKELCKQGAGFDFLAVCGDVMRERSFQSNKPGVASKSRHKTGQAFDYNQADPRLIIVSDPHDGKQYFRTWLKCSGDLGKAVKLRDIRGFVYSGNAWDFTQAAESVGFERIPAWKGWQTSYTKKEFWHYQLTEGTTYEEAIDYLYNVPVVPKPDVDLTVLQKGSKGELVKEYQLKLFKLGFLSSAKEADGIFGSRTELAVKAFQKAHGLTTDGKIGPFTRGKIDQLLKEKKAMSTNFDYNVDEVNAAVSAEAEENVTPKPWYATSQFAVLLATYVLGPVAMWLTAKGLLTPETAPQFVAILQGAIVVGMGWVSQKYIAGRNEVSAIKARAAAVRSLGSNPQALAAFRSLDRS